VRPIPSASIYFSIAFGRRVRRAGKQPACHLIRFRSSWGTRISGTRSMPRLATELTPCLPSIVRYTSPNRKYLSLCACPVWMMGSSSHLMSVPTNVNVQDRYCAASVILNRRGGTSGSKVGLTAVCGPGFLDGRRREPPCSHDLPSAPRAAFFRAIVLIRNLFLVQGVTGAPQPPRG
jgi:hypothetical protein